MDDRGDLLSHELWGVKNGQTNKLLLHGQGWRNLTLSSVLSSLSVVADCDFSF